MNGLLLILKPQSYLLSHSASVVEEKAGASDTTCPSLTAEVFYGSAPASVNTKNQFILSKMFVVGISQNIGQSDLVVMYQ